MAEARTIESILIADCGTVFTKLLLLERVEDSYRFVAQAETLTTMNPPWSDLGVGVVQALEQLEQITGRTLYASGRLITPQQGLEGVDAFVVTLSASEPLSLVIAGLVREMSLESARRAAAGTYTNIKAFLSREGSLNSPQETWARTIRDLAPDVVMLVGGVDGGARRPVMELADAIALAASMLEPDHRPTVLYAGNAELRPQITKLLGDITHVEVVDNVHPSADTEHLGPAQNALEQMYIEERMNTAPGADALMAWSRLPLLPTATAFSRVVDYLYHREGQPSRGVLGIDIGAATTTVAATFEGRPYVTIYEKGIAYGPLSWIKEHDVAALLQWIPEEMEAEELLALLYNRELRPWTAPQDPRELWIEQAIAREMLRSALAVALPTWDVGKGSKRSEMMPHVDPILITGGGLVHMPRPGQALLVVLDGLQPTGISTILLDVNRAAPALGAVAGLKPLAAAAALEAGTLVSLGTVISPVGKARPGDVVLRMRITYEDGGTLNVEARYGDIEIWPLLPGQKASLEVRPNHHFDVGLGPGRGGKVQVVGGLVGLVVDARGRPLTLPDDPDRRRRILHGWIWDVGG
ncbi:MAG TPA: glutamate mutase L [Anaerolineae bacterium]|nr:glutamate mutase L [Anaerolineae bacterium]HQK15009.1 glutamate mutase L [Anaerolineae bacterium]